MIWSFLKFAIFLGIAAALAWVATYIIDTGGEVRVAFGTTELSVSPIVAVLLFGAALIAAYILLRLAGLLVAVLRFVNGDNTAISRYFDRNREKHGYKALSEGMIALAAGDGRTAMKRAASAERYLEGSSATQLIAAQAATLTGDTPRAQEHFKALLKDDATRFVGIRGLLQQKLDAGDTDTALALAQKAFQTNPSHDPTLQTLFQLQSEKEDWSGARDTLKARVRTRALPKDLGTRRDAVLSLADAIGEEDAAARKDAALAANKAAPGLVPAAALAAKEHIASGDKRKAANVIKKAWAQNQHPDLAAAFAAIEPDETPEARLRRFGPILKIKPAAIETQLLEAELNLAAEDFPAARKALGDLATSDPTARSLSIMAAVERGQGAEEAVVSGWLAKALAAPRGDSWVCGACNHIAGSWAPLCDNCSGFDTLDWTRVPASEDAQALAAAMLPLLAGANGVGESDAAEDTSDGDIVETGSDTASADNADAAAKPAAAAS